MVASLSVIVSNAGAASTPIYSWAGLFPKKATVAKRNSPKIRPALDWKDLRMIKNNKLDEQNKGRRPRGGVAIPKNRHTYEPYKKM